VVVVSECKIKPLIEETKCLPAPDKIDGLQTCIPRELDDCLANLRNNRTEPWSPNTLWNDTHRAVCTVLNDPRALLQIDKARQKAVCGRRVNL